MSHTGTMRGTPKNRNQPARAQFVDSPSGIPRPALETHASHVHGSDVGGASTLSASRAKQSKRDEVRTIPPVVAQGLLLTVVRPLPRPSAARSRRT